MSGMTVSKVGYARLEHGIKGQKVIEEETVG